MFLFNKNNFLYLSIALLILENSLLYAASDTPNSTANDSTTTLKTIVVTLKPIYSLVAHLTDGISTPVLLSSNMQSPHHHNIRPSERRLLDKADMIIWLGPQMETYLAKIIRHKNTTINISLMQAKNLSLLVKRSNHSYNVNHEHASDEFSNDKVDQHIWLSSTNAKAVSHYLYEKLIAADSKNIERYKTNLKKLLNKIEQTNNQIKNILKDNHQPFIVAHDAFQYFEKEYNLNYIAAINFGDDTSTSAKHLTEINSQIKKNDIHCIIYQQPKPDIIDTLTRKREIRATALDPLGINLNNHDDYNSWFTIMKNLADNFHQCLNP